jgi:hypothetical protein
MNQFYLNLINQSIIFYYKDTQQEKNSNVLSFSSMDTHVNNSFIQFDLNFIIIIKLFILHIRKSSMNH